MSKTVSDVRPHILSDKDINVHWRFSLTEACGGGDTHNHLIGRVVLVVVVGPPWQRWDKILYFPVPGLPLAS